MKYPFPQFPSILKREGLIKRRIIGLPFQASVPVSGFQTDFLLGVHAEATRERQGTLDFKLYLGEIPFKAILPFKAMECYQSFLFVVLSETT